jgi:hypothetical protein
MGNKYYTDCYINLANAIIIQACDDYMAAKRKLIKARTKRNNLQNDLATESDLEKINKDIILYTSIIESCITFFQSEWAKSLSDTDLMCVKRKMDEKIKKEVKK